MDHDCQISGSDLDPNCLQIVKCRLRVNMGVDFSDSSKTDFDTLNTFMEEVQAFLI